MNEIVQVVLDVVYEDNGHRVVVRGVYPEGVAIPEPLNGSKRNVVQAFVGHTLDIRALYIGDPS
jgi:hypothetical protein